MKNRLIAGILIFQSVSLASYAQKLPIAGMNVVLQSPSISDSAQNSFSFQKETEIKKISPGVYHVRMRILPDHPSRPGCIDLPLTIGLANAEEGTAAKNAFHWLPNIKKAPDEIVAQHVFRSPCILLTLKKKALVFIPDLDAMRNNQAAPYYLDLQYEAAAIRIHYGVSNYNVARHQYYTKSNTVFSLSGPLDLAFYVIIPPDPSPVTALKTANHFLWEHYAATYTKSWLPQTLPFGEYADRGYSMALEHYWVEGPTPGTGGITLSTYYDEKEKKYGGRFYKDDLWFHSWFNNTRTAYGLYYWGHQQHKENWQKAAEATLRLILSSPKDGGWFPTIYAGKEKGWISSGQGGKPGLYHMPDNVWTAYWILRFDDELKKMPGAESFTQDFAGAILDSQNPDGSYPTRVKATSHQADSVLRSSATSSMATWYLEEMLLRNKLPATLTDKYKRSIRQSLDFLDSYVLPQQRFEDFELYFSCSPKPMHYFDSSTQLYGQNTLSIQWCAEAYLKAYQLFKDKKYLQQGEYCLNILGLYQQVWNPYFIDLYAFGGFGVQNTDAEWNDARQAQFAETFMNFYFATGNKDYLERAVYACRSSFALMVIPENKLVCPENYQGVEDNGESWQGTMAENFGHSGYNSRSYQSGFHWGTGSALTTAAVLKRSLGDLYVTKGYAVGVDGIVVDSMDNERDTLHLRAKRLAKGPVEVRTDGSVKTPVAVEDGVALVDYVDPFIGTANGGNVFHGAALPFSMVKLGPDCNTNMASGGYDERNNTIINGFSHVHTSGAGGGPKYGNILVQPFTGKPPIGNAGSSFSQEHPAVGSYKVHLDRYNIQVALTATRSVGLHTYTFPEGGEAGLLFDAGHFLVSRHPTEKQVLVGSAVKILSPTELQGYNRVRGGWGNNGPYTVYFYAVLDNPATSSGVWQNDTLQKGLTYCEGPNSTGAWLSFTAKKGQSVKLKVGISYISAEKARENILREIPDWNFDNALQKARRTWEDRLASIRIECPTDTLKRMFYTGLYHSMLMPVDKTGENPKWNSPAPHYDDFYCIWDTYRCLNPLLTLIAPAVQKDILNSLIDIYKYDRYMPDARAGDGNGRTQGGSNGDILVADAFVKGMKGIDYETALKAMIKNAEVPPGDDEQKEGRGGLPDYNSIGYVSTNYERSGTRTMEYAADDYAIALVAKGLRRNDLFEKYRTRSSNWKNLWRPIADHGANGFIMPRKKDGGWLENFTVLQDGSWHDPFYESHSWEISFYVPQDINGLIETCGGTEAFRNRLDTFFGKEYYNVSNEPGFLTPMLYNWIGRPDLTGQLVRAIIKKNYNAGRRGIPGNDDSGAMSSWLVFQLLGFFPVAGQDLYTIGSPHFSNVTMHLDNGKDLLIRANNLSDKNSYIQSVKLNGHSIDRSWFRHTEIAAGGTLEFEMGSKPGHWATKTMQYEK